MNPTRLWARSYRTFEELELDLPPGCTAILGDNGAGKSSILNLIDLALFGSRDFGRYLTRGAAETELEIGLEFEHRSEMYRVRRSYSARGRGMSKVDLEMCEGGFFDVVGPDGENIEPIEATVWVALTRETATETQTAIEELIGLTRTTFRASAFLAQGDGAAFTEANPGQRKAILGEVLGLDLWDEMLRMARDDRQKVAHESAVLLERLQTAEAELERRAMHEAERDAHEIAKIEADGMVAAVEKLVAGAETYLARVRETDVALRAAKEVEASRHATLSGISLRIVALAKQEEGIEAALQGREESEARAARVPELEERVAELTQLATTYTDLLAAGAELQASLERTRAERAKAIEDAQRLSEQADEVAARAEAKRAEEDAICQTCGLVIHGEAKEKAIAELTATSEEYRRQALVQTEIAEALTPLAAEGEELVVPLKPEPVAPVQAELDAARSAAAYLPVIEERAKQLDGIRAELKQLDVAEDEAEASHKEALHEVERLRLQMEGDSAEVVEKRVEDLRADVSRARSAVEELVRVIARVEAIIEGLTTLAAASDQDRSRRAALLEEEQVLLALEKAFSRDGIPALIIENAAIPQIETEANRILAELGTGYRVELRTQRALKSGEGVREALDIVVFAPDGEALYEDFSGGERTRLNLALRIALARLLAHRRGAEVRMLALDEPEFLDAAGIEALARVLQGLTSDFDRVIVVSHVPALREAFDQVIELKRDGNRSSIVGAREAVAA